MNLLKKLLTTKYELIYTYRSMNLLKKLLNTNLKVHASIR